MNILLIALFLAAALGLFWLGFRYQSGGKELTPGAAVPSEERDYWKSMTVKHKKSYFVGAAGALLAALSVALKKALPAEIGCITLLAALVFALAVLCKKTAFPPSEATEKQQKRWKTLLLLASFAALILTQFVFGYFNTLK